MEKNISRDKQVDGCVWGVMILIVIGLLLKLSFVQPLTKVIDRHLRCNKDSCVIIYK